MNDDIDDLCFMVSSWIEPERDALGVMGVGSAEAVFTCIGSPPDYLACGGRVDHPEYDIPAYIQEVDIIQSEPSTVGYVRMLIYPQGEVNG